MYLGSNRTFMELKYVNITKLSEELSVLIVPLWNWNQGAATQAIDYSSF